MWTNGTTEQVRTALGLKCLKVEKWNIIIEKWNIIIFHIAGSEGWGQPKQNKNVHIQYICVVDLFKSVCDFWKHFKDKTKKNNLPPLTEYNCNIISLLAFFVAKIQTLGKNSDLRVPTYRQVMALQEEL